MFSKTMLGCSLVAILSIHATQAQASSTCDGPSACQISGMAEVCKNAYQRYIDNGIYDSATAYGSKSGDLACSARYVCDSSGSFLHLSGSDLKKAFASIQAQQGSSCGACGSQTLSQHNCLVSLYGCQNCNAGDSGGPASFIPNPASSSTVPVGGTTTSKTSTPPPVTTKTTGNSQSSQPSSPTSVRNTNTNGGPGATSNSPSDPTSTTSPPQDEDNAHQEVNNAQRSVDSYKNNPTSSSAAQAAHDAIQKALDVAKKAAETTTDSAIKSAENSLVSALSNALDKAATAAAGPTTEAAAALSAAMASVIAADNSVQNARNPQPSNASGTPKTPGTTAIPSNTLSSVSTSASSSTTTTTAACSVCVACADATLSIPTTGVSDPFAGFASTETFYDDDTPSNSSLRIRRRMQNRHALSKRASLADRSILICKEQFKAPDYRSYNRAGNGNTYKPYYSYKYKNPESCASYSWELVTSDTKPDNKDYATEHVYELQLIAIFLDWMKDNDNGIIQRLSDPKKINNPNWDFCSAVFRPIFTPNKQWSNQKFGAGRAMTNPGSMPIDDLLSQLSGDSRPDEMVYLEENLNGMKAKLFHDQTVTAGNTYLGILATVARASLVYEYLSDDNISKIFRDVSYRIYDFFERLDRAQQSGISAFAKKIKWAQGYAKWEKEYLKIIDATLQAWKDSEVKQAQDQIAEAQKKAKSTALQRLNDAITAQLTTGKLTNGNFQCASKLTN